MNELKYYRKTKISFQDKIISIFFIIIFLYIINFSLYMFPSFHLTNLHLILLNSVLIIIMIIYLFYRDTNIKKVIITKDEVQIKYRNKIKNIYFQNVKGIHISIFNNEKSIAFLNYNNKFSYTIRGRYFTDIEEMYLNVLNLYKEYLKSNNKEIFITKNLSLKNNVLYFKDNYLPVSKIKFVVNNDNTSIRIKKTVNLMISIINDDFTIRKEWISTSNLYNKEILLDYFKENKVLVYNIDLNNKDNVSEIDKIIKETN